MCPYFCSDSQIVHLCPNFPASSSRPALLGALQLGVLLLQKARCNFFSCVHFPHARLNFVPTLLATTLSCLHPPALRWSREQDLWLPLSFDS